MSKEFECWAAGVFSWEETIDQHQLDLCQDAWDACKSQVIKLILENSYPASGYDSYAIDLKDKIERL